MNKKKLAIVGYHDGFAGQIFSYLDELNDYKLECFCKGSGSFKYVNISEELENRSNKKIEFPKNGKFYNIPFYDTDDWISDILNKKVKYAFCINPNNHIRFEDMKICTSNNIQLINIIHPSVIIMPQVKLGKNIWINANSFIGYKTLIKDGVIINSNVNIDHHNVIEELVQFDPRVTTAGFVNVGKYSHIHTGSTLINKISIGNNSEIGAGSLVLDDLEGNYLYYGSPAIKIRKLNNLVLKKKKIVLFADFNYQESIDGLNIILENLKYFDILAIICSKNSIGKAPKALKNFKIFYDGFPHLNKDLISYLKKNMPDFGISTSFPNRIRVKIIKLLNNIIYNFHPSVLPDNKGSHSSFYSIINNTDFGATMHLMNKEFDSGKILDHIKFKNKIEYDAEFIHKKSKEFCLKLIKRNIVNMYNNEFTTQANKKTKINFKKDINLHNIIYLQKKYTGQELWNLIRAVHFQNNGLFFKLNDKRKIKVVPKIDSLIENN